MSRLALSLASLTVSVCVSFTCLAGNGYSVPPLKPIELNPERLVAPTPPKCQPVETHNLTAQEAKALMFVLEAKYDGNGALQVGCAESLSAKDKFPVRGHTVVEYELTVRFPNGHRTECLDAPGGPDAFLQRLALPLPGLYCGHVLCVADLVDGLHPVDRIQRDLRFESRRVGPALRLTQLCLTLSLGSSI